MTYMWFFIGTSQNSSPEASMQTVHCKTFSLLLQLQERVVSSYTTHRARAVPGPCTGRPCLLTGCTHRRRQSPPSGCHVRPTSDIFGAELPLQIWFR